MRLAKKALLIIVVSIMTLALTGCKNLRILPPRVEISELNLVRAMAVDKGEDGGILVTITSKKEGENQGTGSGEGGPATTEQVIVLSAEGQTIESAVRQFQTYINKRVFWGHCTFFLIGEEAARQDISRYLDFYVRNHAVRMNSFVYVTKGKAADFLEKSNIPGFFIADYLKSLSKNVSLVSYSDSMDVLDLAKELDDNTTFGAAVPALSLSEGTVRAKGLEITLEKDVKQEGYAIIKDYKLVAFLDPPVSRGYNTIKNRLVSGFINVRDRSGANLGLEIIQSVTRIKPVVENGQLKEVKIVNHLETNIDEVQSKMNVFDEDCIFYLEDQQEQVIKSEIEECVRLAQKLNADFLGIGKAVRLKHPILWEKIKDRWNEIFPELDIKVEVESHVNRTYDIKEPTGYKESE